MLRTMRLVAAVIVAAFPLDAAALQTADPVDPAEAVYSAARYVLSSEKALPSPARIVVDVETGIGFSAEGTPIGAATKVAATKLAADVGARSGRLHSFFACGGDLPGIDELTRGYIGRCWLSDNTELIVQVSDPRLDGDAAYVWVALWRGIRDSVGEPMYVSSHSREVRLVRNDRGEWAPVEMVRARFGHY